MNSKLEHALALAEQGFYVFPCEEDGSTPIVKFTKESTRDAEKIRNWWIDPIMGWPQGYNIGIDTGKSGLLVIDIDCKAGKPGKETLAKLLEEHKLPETYTVHTPSGGLHFYYRGHKGHTITAGKEGYGLGAGIDTRGEGGYVLAVGSERNGIKYTLEDLSDGTIPDLPLWVDDMLAKNRAHSSPDKGATYIEDHPDDITRAIDYLTNDAEPAVEGSAGDQTTFAVACMVKDFGLSRETALDLMYEHYNERCSPPWDHEDLEKKINSAYKSAKTATGSKSAFAEFTPVQTTEPEAIFLRPASRRKPKDIPRREWTFGNLAMRRKVTIAIAPAGAGKSTFTLAMAISKATGRNILGINPHGKGAVAVWNNEDDMDELDRRTAALMQHYRVADEELFDEDVRGDEQRCYLYLNSGEDRPFQIAKRVGPQGILKPADADIMVEHLLKYKIEMLIVDPFAETHPANENSNEEILTIARMYRYIAQKADCAVILVHHTRKPDGASSEGQSGKMESARGASSLSGVARIMFTLTGMTEKQAKVYGLPEEMRSKYILLELAKANMSAPGGDRQWFERYGEVINASIDDPDGEQVGILKPIKLTPRKEGANDQTLNLINDIAVLVSDGAMPVKEVSEGLISSFPFHSDKKPGTLDKAIRRLFDDGSVPCPAGMLHLEDTGSKAGKMLRLAPLVMDAVLETVTSIEQLL